MTEQQLTTYLKEAALIEGVPWELVKAVCRAESSFDQYAMRYEPHYKWLVGAETITPTERVGQMTSWGLMQVMGAVAREYGFAGYFPRLCEPGVGLHYGMRHLKKFYDKYRNWPDSIASYNAGRPVRTDGRYVNQPYVDKVLRYWNEYEIQIQLKDTDA